MQKFFKRAAILTLCLAMLLPIVGCGSNSGETTGATAGAAPAGTATMDQYGTVWSAPSTVKIDQNDITYANKGGAELKFNAVKNEYESHQLFITAKTDVSAYYLESCDLMSGSNVLSKDNITVYMERYVKVAEAAYGSYSLPDALIPVDAALKKGELKIAKDQNAAFWVTVYIPADTPAGVYTGNFKLTVDNAAMDIPVQVTVNDYVLPETTTGQTLFSWRYDRIGAGELDSSIQMMETYYEFFLDYRISLQSLPMESLTREEVVDTLKKYYDVMSTYTIGPEPGEVPGGGFLSQSEQSKEMIMAIASISGPERDYFEKAMLYVVDEPDLSTTEKYNYAMHMITSVNDFLAECVEDIRADNTGTYDNFKSIEGWENSILDIPNIMPITEGAASWLLRGITSEATREAAEAFLASINTVCPTFDVFTDQWAEKLLALCEEYGIENIWWYGCTGPRAPYPNYHIGDKNLLSARSYSWIQAKYGIEGNLYWDAAAYTDEASFYYNQYIDVYEEPFRGTHTAWPAGDGFLSYPGAAYDIYGPLPSMRLMSLRDGMEELEMLLDLEEQYEGMAAVYGSEFNARESIASIVDTVCYNGSAVYADGENGLDFDALRGSVIDSLVWNEMGIGFVLAESSVTGSTANISYYVSEDCKVYIGGELQQPVSGCQYAYVLNLDESTSLNLTIETADGSKYEVSRFISFPTRILQTFEDASALDPITITEGSTVALSGSDGFATEGTSAHIQVMGKVTGEVLVDATYAPTVSFDLSMFEGITNLTEVQIMKMDFYNANEAFKFQVKIYAGNSYVSAGEYTIDTGKTTISIQISGISFSSMASADRIVFEFENSTDGETPNSYEFYLDNIIATE